MKNLQIFLGLIAVVGFGIGVYGFQGPSAGCTPETCTKPLTQDYANQRVGINKSNPQVALDVNGGMRIGQFLTADLGNIPCDGNRLGSIVFDKEEDVVKVCKSGGWSIFETDCELTNETVHGHIYNVPAIDYAQISDVTSQPYAISNGQATSEQTFVCDDGTLNVSGGEVETITQCNSGYIENNGSCKSYGAYTYSGWSSCSVTCGGGTQTRTQYCNYDICHSPQSTSQSCNTQSCYTYSWYTGSYGSCSANPYWGSWGSCSASCGGGIQYRSCYGTSGSMSRTVYCRRSDGSSVSDGYCSGSKPGSSTSCSESCVGSSSQSCNTQSCCHSQAGQPCTLSRQRTIIWNCSSYPSGAVYTYDSGFGSYIADCYENGVQIACSSPSQSGTTIYCAWDKTGTRQCDGSCI